MPLPIDALVMLASMCDEAGITEADVLLLKENKIFAQRAMFALREVCEQARGLSKDTPLAITYPDTFGEAYFRQANRLLVDLKVENGKRTYVVRIFAAFLFLSRKEPTTRLTAAAAAKILGISRQAVSRGLRNAEIEMEDLLERLRE